MSYSAHAHIGREHYRQEVRTDINQIISDEPTDNGGKGLGFSPHQLLAAALATCTNATVRMYADRKEWPLEAIDTKVELQHGDSFDQTHIKRTVRFTGNLDEQQRERLLQIANRCPIHRTLTGAIDVSTEVA